MTAWPFAGTGHAPDSAQILVHYGIPRTSSSSIRGVLRRAARLYCTRLQHLSPEEPRIREGIDILMTEAPLTRHSFNGREPRFVTTLRDPVTTTVSFYYHRRLLATQRPEYGTDLSPLEYTGALPRSLNMAARFIASLHRAEPFRLAVKTPDFLTDRSGFFKDIPDGELFDMAREVIDARFDLITPHDRFEPLLFHVAARMHWPRLPAYQAINWSPHFAHGSDWADPEIRERLIAANAVDAKIAAYAAKRFAKAIEAVEAGCGPHLAAYRDLSERAASACLGGNNLVLRDGKILPDPHGPKQLELTREDLDRTVMIEDFLD